MCGICGILGRGEGARFDASLIERMSGVFFDYLMSGRMNVAELVTHRYSPLQAPEAYLGLLKDRSTDVGVIFDWTMLD